MSVLASLYTWVCPVVMGLASRFGREQFPNPLIGYRAYARSARRSARRIALWYGQIEWSPEDSARGCQTTHRPA
jgi:hypothetical protein